MHIDTNQVTGRNPYKDFIGWDTKWRAGALVANENSYAN
jgi:hypothetical protein